MTKKISAKSGLMCERQLAKHWGIKENTLQKWRSMGLGPIYMKIGGKVIYPIESIMEYEKNRLYRSSSEKVYTDQRGGHEE